MKQKIFIAVALTFGFLGLSSRGELAEQVTREKVGKGRIRETRTFLRDGKKILARVRESFPSTGTIISHTVFHEGKAVFVLTKCDAGTGISSFGREGLAWFLSRDAATGKTQLTLVRKDTGVVDAFTLTSEGMEPMSDHELQKLAGKTGLNVAAIKSLPGKTMQEALDVLRKIQDINGEQNNAASPGKRTAPLVPRAAVPGK